MSAGSWCAIRRKSSRRVGPIRIKHGGGGGPYVALPNVEHLSVLLTNQLIRIATRIPHELAAAAVPLETCRHGRAGPRRPPRHGLGAGYGRRGRPHGAPAPAGLHHTPGEPGRLMGLSLSDPRCSRRFAGWILFSVLTGPTCTTLPAPIDGLFAELYGQSGMIRVGRPGLTPVTLTRHGSA